MARAPRHAPGGIIFHTLNRGVGRRQIFDKPQDYLAFERVIADALAAEPLHVLAYCLMPNHWHLLLRPEQDGQLGRFMQRLTMTHTRRWQEHYHEVGTGHLYQGRFKSFPVQHDGHFLTVARYIERNALRAGLVERAEDWPWSSLWRRAGRVYDSQRPALPLANWPMEQPSDWLAWVNEPQTDAELNELRMAVGRGRPFGSGPWRRSMVERLNLQSSERARGRPRKAETRQEARNA